MLLLGMRAFAGAVGALLPPGWLALSSRRVALAVASLAATAVSGPPALVQVDALLVLASLYDDLYEKPIKAPPSSLCVAGCYVFGLGAAHVAAGALSIATLNWSDGPSMSMLINNLVHPVGLCWAVAMASVVAPGASFGRGGGSAAVYAGAAAAACTRFAIGASAAARRRAELERLEVWRCPHAGERLLAYTHTYAYDFRGVVFVVMNSKLDRAVAAFWCTENKCEAFRSFQTHHLMRDLMRGRFGPVGTGEVSRRLRDALPLVRGTPCDRTVRSTVAYLHAQERREARAAAAIQRAWRRSVADPAYLACRRRLRRELEELMDGDG